MRVGTFRRFLDDDTGATAIEYALLGTLIAVALAATFVVLGDVVANMFGSGTEGATGTIIEQTKKL